MMGGGKKKKEKPIMYEQETKYRGLAKMLSYYNCIFVDTCSLMEESFPEFVKTLNSLHKDDYWIEKITILSQCIDELKKHSKSKDASKRIDAKAALKILRKDRWHTKIFKIEKGKKSLAGFADKALFNLVNEIRTRQRVLVITQDKKLAYDIRGLNHLGSQRGKTVDVYKVRRDGWLEPNLGENENGFSPRQNNKPFVNDSRKEDVKGHFNKPFAPKKDDKTSLIEEQDKRLSSNLSNPNYPKDKKIKDIESQIEAISKLDEKAKGSLRLAFTLPQLAKEKEKLMTPVKAPLPSRREANKGEKEAKNVIEPKKETINKDKPRSVSAHTEKGRNASFAFERLGEHYGWLFRDSSLPFVKGVHGEVDLTSMDLKKMDAITSSMKVNESKDVSFGNIKIHVVKEADSFVLSLVENQRKEEKPKEVKTPSKIKKSPAKVAEKKPKQTEAKTNEKTIKVASKDPTKKKSESKNEQKKAPKKADTKKLTPTPKKPMPALKKKEVKPLSIDGGMAAVPSGVTLFVGGPKERKMTSSSDKPQSLEEKEKMEAAGKKVGDLHRIASKKEDKPTPKKSRAPSKNYADAIKNDKVLNANLNNPNYPKDSKIRDIEFQMALIHTLKQSEMKNLLLGLRVLEHRLKELKA